MHRYEEVRIVHVLINTLAISAHVKNSIKFDKELPIMMNNVMWGITAVISVMLTMTFWKKKYMWLMLCINTIYVLKCILVEINIDEKQLNMSLEDFQIL